MYELSSTELVWRPKCLFQCSVWMYFTTWLPMCNYNVHVGVTNLWTVVHRTGMTTNVSIPVFVVNVGTADVLCINAIALYFTTRLPMCNHHVHCWRLPIYELVSGVWMYFTIVITVFILALPFYELSSTKVSIPVFVVNVGTADVLCINTIALYFTNRLPMCNHHVHVGVYQFMNCLPVLHNSITNV